MGEEIRGMKNREVKKEKTGEELLKEAGNGLESLEEDIENINKDTLPGRREIFWMEAEEKIGLFKEASQKLVEEGIELRRKLIEEGIELRRKELRRKGNIKEGENRILEGLSALTTMIELRKEIIKSMQRADSPKEEIRARNSKIVEELGNFLYLHLKAEILGNMSELLELRVGLRRKLVDLEILVEPGEKREKVSEKWLEQVKIWRKELQKQKKEEIERRE